MKKIYLLGIILLIGIRYSTAQLYAPTTRVWASSQEGPNVAFVDAFGVSDNANAYDSDPQTYSQLNSTLVIAGLGSPFQNLGFSSKIPAGTTLHIKVGNAGGLLNLAGGIRVQTFNGTGGFEPNVDDEVVGGSASLISLLSGGNQIDYTIKTSGECQYVRVSFPSLVSVAGGFIRLYGAYYETPLSSGSIACDTRSDYLSGVQSNALLDAASLASAVLNPQNAFDGDANTSASIVSVAAVGNYSHVTAIWPGMSRQGDSVRIIFGQGGTVLNLNLLTNLTIQTFKNDTAVQTLDNTAGILNLRLLDANAQKYILSFMPTGEFNRVSVRNAALVAANLGVAYEIYEIQRGIAAPQANMASGYTTIYSGQSATLPALTPVASTDVAKWYKTSNNMPLAGANTGALTQ